MFKDGNRPDGSYGYHYDKMTGANKRSNTQQPVEFAKWECEAIDNLLEKVNSDLHQTYTTSEALEVEPQLPDEQ